MRAVIGDLNALTMAGACRGDVGSWVREAAIIALAKMLPLWWQHKSVQDAEHPRSQQSAGEPSLSSLMVWWKHCRVADMTSKDTADLQGSDTYRLRTCTE